MAISYPLTLPLTGSLSFENVQIGMQEVTPMVESKFSLQQTVYDYGAERWAIAISYPALTPEQAREVIAFLLSLHGSKGTFQANDPLMKTPRGQWGTTPLVKGGSQTGYTLIIDGLLTSTTGVVKAGDYFQIGTSLYMVLKDANSNGSGEATLDITPKLRSSPADNAAITISNPLGLFRRSTPYQVWSSDKGRTYNVSFAGVEAI